MYLLQSKKKQKELVTYYNPQGKKTKQYWYWNGDKQYHNVETFIYSPEGLLTSLIDSFAEGNVERTKFVYENKTLKWRLTLNQKNDTCNYRIYPDKNTDIQIWYNEGQPYRTDTTVFERENVKLYYRGNELNNGRWNYKYANKFDSNGNLLEVAMDKPMKSRKVYSYNNRNLLVKKEEQMLFGSKPIMAVHYFEYK
jgi:hypothetical protein